MRTLTFLLFALGGLAGLSAYGAPAPSYRGPAARTFAESLVGIWLMDYSDERGIPILLAADGFYGSYFYGLDKLPMTGTWVVAGDVLTVRYKDPYYPRLAPGVWRVRLDPPTTGGVHKGVFCSWGAPFRLYPKATNQESGVRGQGSGVE